MRSMLAVSGEEEEKEIEVIGELHSGDMWLQLLNLLDMPHSMQQLLLISRM